MDSFTDPPPQIYRLPPDLWYLVASSCDREALSALSMTSKHIRRILVPFMFFKARFETIGWENVITLPEISGLTSIRLYIKRVEMHFILRFYSALHPTHLRQCIEVLENLQRLTLILDMPAEQSNDLSRRLLGCPGWKITHLNIRGRATLTSDIIRKCTCLEALQIDSWIGSQAYKTASTWQGRLKELSLSIRRSQPDQDSLIPSINGSSLRRILTSFRGLEVLCIRDLNAVSTTFIPMPRLQTALENSFTVLRDFSKLRCLAFTFPFFHVNNVDGFIMDWYIVLLDTMSERLPKVFDIQVFSFNPG